VNLKNIFTPFNIASLLIFLPLFVSAQMELVENKGQWNDAVLYKGEFSTGSFFIEPSGFTMYMKDTAGMRQLANYMHNEAGKSVSPFVLKSVAYKVKFSGASVHPVQVPEKPFSNYNNYYIGNDPSQWASGCKIYQSVLLKDVYPNIDVRYYSNAGAIKYDFIVHPGGNPGLIAMQYDGPVDLSVKSGDLLVNTPVGQIRELKPYAYTITGTGRNDESVSYVLRGNQVTLSVKKYDYTKTLVIDPSVIFVSFTGSTADNWGYTATPGPDGSGFAGGIVFGDGYPVSPGAFDQTFGGGQSEGVVPGFDIGIIHLSANGSQRLYATYLGGSGNEQPHSMIADQSGNLYVTGRTSSENFPTTNSNIGPCGEEDIFVCKFNASGTQILRSVKVGGSGRDGVNIRPKYEAPSGVDAIRRNYGDDARGEIIFDYSGNVIVAGCTQSTNFPATPGNGIQTSFGGGRQDGVIIKFTSNLSMLWASFFGGSGDDACFVASVNPNNGNIYIGGNTNGSVLPGPMTNVLYPSFNGGETDGFVTSVTPNGNAIVKTSYMGTSGNDMIYGLKFDKHGFPYIMGATTGSWPVRNATFSNSGGKQFISKLLPDLSGFVYSTVFGTGSPFPNISPVAFMVDRCENVYVSGWGGGIDNGYPNSGTQGLPEVQPLAGIPAADGADFYFFVLEHNATSQLFGSHFGQNGGMGDHVDGGTSRYDENGIIYQAVCANCSGGAQFPTTAGAWSTRNGSSNCNEALLKIEMDFTGVGANLQSYINGVTGDTTGCLPLTVMFKDTTQKGVTYYWNFGDGTPTEATSSPQHSHTFQQTGVFQVMLIAEDSSTCNIRDTAYKFIKVGDNIVSPDFNWAKLPPCESLSVQFTNTSTVNTGNFGPQSFVWDFGDGSQPDTSNLLPPVNHSYAQPGNYEVTLTIIDPEFCNAPDSVKKTIRINPLVEASFQTPGEGCAPYQAVFTNTSKAGTDFIWDFGDGQTSTEENPVHLYQTPGDYHVKLIAIDTSTCNKQDTSTVFVIHVVDKPHAEFTWGPNPPQVNTPVSFTNLSSADAVNFSWDFGDGLSGSDRNPVHEYVASGQYMVTLIAFNALGCPDTFRLPVKVLIEPLIDVPNAFTPGRFGTNSIVRVVGFGISKLEWKIYNRWGQMIFRATSKEQGWDGTYKGKLQPMDVYTYTLDAIFSDGKKVHKSGDITLLR